MKQAQVNRIARDVVASNLLLDPAPKLRQQLAKLSVIERREVAKRVVNLLTLDKTKLAALSGRTDRRLRKP